MDRKIIVTNATPLGNYTPVACKDMEDANNWMKECTAGNIRNYTGGTPVGDGRIVNDLDDDEVIEWAEENLDGFEYVEDKKSYVEYSDGSYNHMQIFKVEM